MSTWRLFHRRWIYGMLGVCVGGLCLEGGWGLARGFAAEPGKDAAAKVLPLPGEEFKVERRTAFVIPPASSTTGSVIPWVWYAPTLPGLPGTEERWMFERFLAAGIAIAGIDAGESYGSPDGCALYSAFFEEMTTRRPYSRKPSLLARSRGGLMLYNWAADHPASVSAIAGIYPVCNLISYPGLAVAHGAYHLTEAQLADQITKYNPIDRLEGLAAARVPIYHIHGDSDTVVPLEANSGELARRYQQLGGPITLKVIPGQGHNMWSGWFEDQELVDFVIANSQASGVPRWNGK